MERSLAILLGAIFSLSAVGDFAWCDDVVVDRLESRIPVLEAQVRSACADERSGEARAFLAYMTYTRATALTDELKSEVKQLNRFLTAPEEIAYQKIQDDVAKARKGSRDNAKALLDQEVQKLDWLRIQSSSGAPVSGETMDQQREKVKQSKRMLDYYERTDASSVGPGFMSTDQMQKLLSVKIDEALKRMKQLSALGRRYDQASSAAWGCWVTATNSGKLADSTSNISAAAPGGR